MLRKKTIICQSEVDAKREIVIASLSLLVIYRVFFDRKEIPAENETDNTNSSRQPGKISER